MQIDAPWIRRAGAWVTPALMCWLLSCDSSEGPTGPAQQPAVKLGATSLTPSCFLGGNPAAQSFDISNGGTGSLKFTVTKSPASWLTVTPDSGTSIDSLDKKSIDVTYTTSGLNAGVYLCTLSIAAPGVVSKALAVTLTVNCLEPTSSTMLKLLTPNGCRSYRVGDTMAITWHIDSVKTSMQVFFSGDGNRFALTIGNVGATMPNYREGPFLWVIPDFVVSQDGFDTIRTISDSCVVTVRDYNISRITDGSDRMFSISAR